MGLFMHASLLCVGIFYSTKIIWWRFLGFNIIYPSYLCIFFFLGQFGCMETFNKSSSLWWVPHSIIQFTSIIKTIYIFFLIIFFIAIISNWLSYSIVDGRPYITYTCSNCPHYVYYKKFLVPTWCLLLVLWKGTQCSNSEVIIIIFFLVSYEISFIYF